MSRKVVTSGDVAKLADVSQSAVSRAFTPGASIAPATRSRILTAAQELGYRPNALARAMISGRSKLIALLVAYLDNQFYPLVIDEISRKLQQQGYNVLLFVADRGQQDNLIQQMMQYQVEGIIMASSTLSSDAARQCAEAGIPVVLLNRYVLSSEISTVTSDNFQGGVLAANFLIAGGHQRIAFIAGEEDSSTNQDREGGFYKAMQEHGMQIWARGVGSYDFSCAGQAARNVFSGDVKPDAVFVANDHMAFAVMDVLRDELNLRVPEDVSVIGYDNVPQAALGGYKLTTLAHPVPEQVESALSILLEQINNQALKKRSIVHPVNLVIRESARLPK